MAQSSKKVDLAITTSPDAEIFLIANDRQVVARAVGKLQTEQPPAFYKVRVARAAAVKETLIDLSKATDLYVEAPSLDTVAPFESSLGAERSKQVQDFARSVRSKGSNVLVVGRVAAHEDVSSRTSPLGGLRLFPWRDLANACSLNAASQQAPVGKEKWAVSACRVAPGNYVLEIFDGLRTVRQLVPVIGDWETRIYVRQSASQKDATMPAEHGLQRQSRLTEVAVHLAHVDEPVVLTKEHETSEVARLALASGRRMITTNGAIMDYLRAQFIDPISGVLGAHLMLDTIEQTSRHTRWDVPQGAALNADFSRTDVEAVFAELSTLLFGDGPVSETPADFVALKLRAGLPVEAGEATITAPPMFYRSWEVLHAASLGADPKVKLVGIFAECGAYVALGPYFAWNPSRGGERAYVDRVVASNADILQRLAVPQSEKAPSRAAKAPEGSVEHNIERFADLAGIPRALLKQPSIASHFHKTKGST